MLPREKFSKRNISALTDTELIAIILSTGIKGRDFMRLSGDVVRKIKNVELVEDIYPTITLLKGVGQVKAMKIVAGIELGKRLFGKTDGRKVRIVNSQQAYEYVKKIGKFKQEHLIAVYLNARYEVLLKRTISIGSLDKVSVSPRDIIIPGLENNCAFVLLAHNHPSGDSSPSKDDSFVTKSLVEALKIVGIKLLDHIVVSETGWQSVSIK
jgi:DNA repair protein RadC